MLKKKLWFFLFLIVIMGMWGAHIAIFFYNPPFFSPSVQKEERVSEGDSFKTVSDLLARDGLVTNSLYFRILGKWTKNDDKIKPGFYSLHTAMRPMEILDQLVEGNILKKEVVLREGLTSTAIAKLLEEAGFLQAEEFTRAIRDPDLLTEFGIAAESLEGYLFPATYHFPKGATAYMIIKRLVDEFKIRFNADLQTQADLMGMTRHEVVTLASIIDKETATDEERPIISAVFHNRLKLGMRLQSDPTVIFGIENFNGDLTRKDLLTPTPYNTYTIEGLPPGPISNPGEAALEAVLNPADVDYLFFVSKNNGRHYFSETLAEHNAAVNKYQRQASVGDSDG